MERRAASEDLGDVARGPPRAGAGHPVLTSYATTDKLYCVYIAPSPNVIEQHAARGGFPCNRVSLVGAVIDPTTAER